VPLAWTGLVIALLTIAVALVPAGPAPLRALVALAFATLGPGAALLSWLSRPMPSGRGTNWPSREPIVTWALVVLTSLATFAGATTALLWIGWWHPEIAVLPAAGAVAAACLAVLLRTANRPAIRAAARPAVWLAAWPGAARAAAGYAGVAAGAGLWLVAVARTDAGQVGEFGLLSSVHPAFFVALLVCVAGFLAELRRSAGGRGPVLGGYAVLLILILHATTPLVLDQPQYAWTYKHVGVVELLIGNGGLTDSGDLYQQWPALFSGVAGVADLAGVAPLSLARWAPVFFNLAGALVMLAIGRTLSPDRRVAYLATFLFLALNWIEEDYLAPQALAYLLGLGVLLVVLRWFRARPPARSGWLARLYRGLPPGAGAARPSAGRMAALAVLVLLFAVLTASHQLSPYLVVGQVAVLVVLGLVRPRWTAALLAAIAVGYLLPRFGLVSGSFDVFESFNIFGNASGNADGWGSAGQAFSATVVRILALTVWGLAAVAVWRARHRLGTVLVPAVLAFTPFVLLFVQSYGGEAIYRVYLFSVPWCAFLIAGLVLRARPRWGGARRAVVWVAAVLALAAAALGTVQGRHGQLMVDQLGTAEVAAAQYLYANAAPGATIALATSNFPSRLAGNYDQFNRALAVGEPELIEGAEMRDAVLDFRYVPGIEDYLRTFDGTTSYLVISDGMRRQAEYFGLLPAGSLDTLDESLSSSPGWSVFYRNDEVVIYQYGG
jgi:hypothetical protein